ncbi:MAG TPA: hypothetical protein PK024_05035 [Methanospirillum sp.]|uniref:hypothetical protein n=1 Tax=Methanospirillum sp. TaxID=45200 RepID=UPI002BDBE3F9|nr:hypothetical protein [Methanospirillum sp.]HOJ96187.1 hypothetical protein [Methanospirillum sp.]HOL41051.1 hypothetical protein [Methanospirillum sp.]HPP77092.1 hypothetical protein [Methanospirillum sp.]
MSTNTEKHPNRPHCLYLWFLHGMPVCSEEKSNRLCPYPFWKCPVKEHQPAAIQPKASDAISEVSDRVTISVNI